MVDGDAWLMQISDDNVNWTDEHTLYLDTMKAIRSNYLDTRQNIKGN